MIHQFKKILVYIKIYSKFILYINTHYLRSYIKSCSVFKMVKPHSSFRCSRMGRLEEGKYHHLKKIGVKKVKVFMRPYFIRPMRWPVVHTLPLLYSFSQKMAPLLKNEPISTFDICNAFASPLMFRISMVSGSLAHSLPSP